MKTAMGDRLPRRVSIPKELAASFRSWRRKAPKDAVYIFQQVSKKEPHHLTWARKNLNTACKQAGVSPFPVSCLRHYHASKLAQDGVALTTIQARLGHSQATTTNRYLHELMGV